MQLEVEGNMRNIFIEGLQGSGKTTLMRLLYEQLDGYRMYMEGEASPVELKWCSYMTATEYQQALMDFPDLASEIETRTVKEEDHFVVEYTQIITDIKGFHHYMEQFEIYYGKHSFDQFNDIIFRRFRRFNGVGNLFECSFFQNIIEELMLYYQRSEEQILDFYRELFAITKQNDFVLLYLSSDDIKEDILRIQRERTDTNGVPLWFPLMMRYLNDTPYGKAHGFNDVDDMADHFQQRMKLEMRIIKEILGAHAIVLPNNSGNVEAVIKQITQN